MPWLGVAETKVNPAGSRSFTETPVAPSGPAFVTCNVKVTLLPRIGAPFETALVSERSAVGTRTATDAWSSSPGMLLFGSESASA